MHYPDQIPQVRFPSARPSGYSSSHNMVPANLYPPSHRDVKASHRINDQFVSLKARLLSMLQTGRLANLPPAFPFRCVPTGNDYTVLHSSFEFMEYVAVDHASKPSRVVFSYTEPSYERRGGSNLPSSNMTWQIRIASQQSYRHGESLTTLLPIAHVEVDPSILESDFALEFMTNPRMLLNLLAISLEQGVHVFMEVATTDSLPAGYVKRSGIPHHKSQLLISVKRSGGQREVVHVYSPWR